MDPIKWTTLEDAISETEKKYSRYLIKIAYNVLADLEDSKESVNDTYLKAWNSMPQHTDDPTIGLKNGSVP